MLLSVCVTYFSRGDFSILLYDLHPALISQVTVFLNDDEDVFIHVVPFGKFLSNKGINMKMTMTMLGFQLRIRQNQFNAELVSRLVLIITKILFTTMEHCALTAGKSLACRG